MKQVTAIYMRPETLLKEIATLAGIFQENR